MGPLEKLPSLEEGMENIPMGGAVLKHQRPEGEVRAEHVSPASEKL